MTDERLEELKVKLISAMKNPRSEFNTNDLYNLNTLITAEQNRRAVPSDEELQQAINHYQYRVTKRQEDIKDYRESGNAELIMAADTFERALLRDQLILTALTQMQKPVAVPCEFCDPEVMDGNPIKWMHSDGYVGNGYSMTGVFAKHCPNCGRQLKGGGE